MRLREFLVKTPLNYKNGAILRVYNIQMDEPALRAWQASNLDLVHFLTIQKQQGEISDITRFAAKRASVHQRNIDRLNELSVGLATSLGTLLEVVSKLRSVYVNPLEELPFDSQEWNMELRKAHFVATKLVTMTEKHYRKWSNQVKKKLEMVMKMTKLYQDEIIPETCVVTIVDSFFEFPREDLFEHQKIERLKLYRTTLSESLRDPQKQPMWKTLGYSRFFDRLIEEALQNMDRNLSYFPNLPRELWLSRAIFGSKSKLKDEIDAKIEEWAKTQFKTMEYEGATFCQNLLKKYNRKRLTEDEESVGLMLYFRLLSDRLYETHKELFAMTDDYARYREKCRNRTLDDITLCENMKPERVSERISECFLADKGYKAAVDMANQAPFYVCPVDVLWCLDRTILLTCQAANFLKMGIPLDRVVQDATPILSWDDSFTLFSEVILASDIPDMYQLHSTAAVMIQTDRVNPFIHNQRSNLEAFVGYWRDDRELDP